jgi:uncharacterized membrane protein
MQLRRACDALVAAAVLGASALAQTSYSVKWIEPLPGGFGSFASGIDERGRVSLWADTTDAVVWSNGRSHVLPALVSGGLTRAEGVGPLGAVVGSSQTSLGEHAVLWELGPAGYTAIDLGVAPGDFQSLAFASSGRFVVGLTDDAIDWRPCVWERVAPGASSFLVDPLPLLSGDFGGEAMDVDASGVIVGTSASFGSVRAVRWRKVAGAWQVQSLEPLAPNFGCAALAVNSRGVAVGWCNSPTAFVEHAVLWRGDAVLDLGAPVSGWRTFAIDVNDRGDVVGRAGPFAIDSGWVRPAATGAMVLLDSLLPTDSPWTIFSAEGIDEQGRIAATGILGGFFHACVLTPIEVFLTAPPSGSAGTTVTFAVDAATPGATIDFHHGTGGGASPLAGCPAGNLDVANAALLGSSVADASGHAALTVFVPAALSGTTVWFQAAEPAACRVTNVERVTW